MNGVERTPENCYPHTVLKLVYSVNNSLVKKINLALISDVLFFTLCAFLICFAALRYFFKSYVWAIIIAALIAVAVCLASLAIALKRREKLIATAALDGERKLLAFHLSTLAPEKLINLFINALDGTYAVGNNLTDGENEYRFCFKIAPLTCDDIADAIKDRGVNQLVLLCCAATAEAVSFAKDFGVKLISMGEIYPLLKDKKLLPDSYPFAGSVKKGVIKKVKSRFNRRLCPSLFFSGLFLLIYSLFSFYPIWYIVAGSVLLTLSAVCLFFAEGD
ncbi:MAG: hypothetical protein ACI4QI_04515 [Candidatus Coproplasma sp.]